MINTDLIKNFNLIDLEAAYNQTMNLIESNFKNCEVIESLYKVYFANNNSVLPYEYSKHREEEIKKAVRRSSWFFILDKMQIDNFISSKRKDEIHKLVNDDKIGPFTAEQVSKIVTDAALNINALVDEAAKEVYEFLMPSWKQKHKTNQYSKGFPPKIIVTTISSYQTWYNTINISYSYKNKLKDLDNIFHLLDGKGPIKYPGDFVTTLEQTAYNKENETEYFRFKVYGGNGNLHLTFKRMDLANKLAAIATKNNLHS